VGEGKAASTSSWQGKVSHAVELESRGQYRDDVSAVRKTGTSHSALSPLGRAERTIDHGSVLYYCDPGTKSATVLSRVRERKATAHGRTSAQGVIEPGSEAS